MRPQIRHPIYKLNCDLQLMVLAAALDASEFPTISQKMLFVFSFSGKMKWWQTKEVEHLRKFYWKQVQDRKVPTCLGIGHMEMMSRALGLAEETQRTFAITTWHWFKLLLGGEVHPKCNWSRKSEGMVTHMAEAGVSLEFPFSNWLIKTHKHPSPCHSVEPVLLKSVQKGHKQSKVK